MNSYEFFLIRIQKKRKYCCHIHKHNYTIFTGVCTDTL